MKSDFLKLIQFNPNVIIVLTNDKIAVQLLYLIVFNVLLRIRVLMGYQTYVRKTLIDERKHSFFFNYPLTSAVGSLHLFDLMKITFRFFYPQVNKLK